MHLALGQLRLEGAIFFRSEFTEGFAIESKICDVASWLHAGRDKLILFHIVAAGSCWLSGPEGERHWAREADVIVVPYADLTNGKLGTPGGTLSGSLTFQASGAPVKLSGSKCKGGPSGETSRQAKVTAGTITATFDSIGKVVLDTNLNGGYEVPELTLVS